MSQQNKNHVLLPCTDFPIRRVADFTLKIKEAWSGLEDRCDAARADAELFVLHDGPPYANGPLHMGHALNKIRKDFENRLAHQRGRRVLYIPGWDCHGLPIESAVEKKFNTHGMSVGERRKLCREFAASQVEMQMQSFLEYGIRGRFERRYTTMEPRSELLIIQRLHDLVRAGLVYRARRPVWWSCVEGTSLAEAELEYQEKQSTAVDVAFVVQNGVLKGCVIPIWTTTPWTLFANQAVAYLPTTQYVLAEKDGIQFLVAEDLLHKFFERVGGKYTVVRSVSAKEFDGLLLLNPADKKVPLLPADFVTAEEGTGFVHIAPAHGVDDFALGTKHNLPVTDAIDAAGRILYQPLRDLVGNARFNEVDSAVCQLLGSRILHSECIRHHYPTSWRSKTPLVYRATDQWFVNVGKVRQRALDAIETVEWVPAKSKSRIRSMVENRPDWCISRQRAWGTPLAIFYNKNTGEVPVDLLDATVTYLRENGVDAWFSDPRAILRASGRNSEDLVPVMDIADVWIDAGLTNQMLTAQEPKVDLPVCMVLEGSDQHRGWFQASLVLACARGEGAPYRSVVTHGFIVDRNGRKMSKSEGNVVDPKDIISEHGADLLRLMVLNTTIGEDFRYSQQSLHGAKTQLERFRGTLRYLLGMLGTDDGGANDAEYMPFEQWMLSRLASVDREWRALTESYNSEQAIKMLYEFCDNEVSGLYFDVRKDVMYCELRASPVRASAIRCMRVMFEYIVRWLSPALPFLTEEAWQYYSGRTAVSVHELSVMPPTKPDAAIEDRYTAAYRLRQAVYKEIELLREGKVVNESRAVQVVVGTALKDQLGCKLTEDEMRELCIVSGFRYASDCSGVNVSAARGARCPRCRFYSSTVEERYCARCERVVDAGV